MRVQLMLLLSLLFSTAANAEVCRMALGADGVAAPELFNVDEYVPIEPAFEDYGLMLEDACAAWGFSVDGGCDIYPMMGDFNWNAVATVCDGNKVIVYDRRLSDTLGYDGAQAVVAHELGHHVCQHLITASSDSYERGRQKELEADRFAGATLRLLGFSKDSISGFASIMADQPSRFHPGRVDRKNAISSGWSDPRTALLCLDPQ